MPIYTKTGDLGETSLFGGKRVPKYDDIVDYYGLIDELNSFIGMIASMVSVVEVKEFLRDIQKDLFTISSYIAGATIEMHSIGKRVDEMEARIDKMDDTLPPLHQFILPGGTQIASFIHITRSVARRAERKAVFIHTYCSDHPHIEKKQSEKIIQYLNRLSDFLFILARFMNKMENSMEVVWSGVKKKNAV